LPRGGAHVREEDVGGGHQIERGLAVLIRSQVERDAAVAPVVELEDGVRRQVAAEGRLEASDADDSPVTCRQS
jgi:hypothetical protein